MRINKYLASCGICSRRNADVLVQEGKVRINGKIIKECGVDIDIKNDNVAVDGKRVKLTTRHTYLMLNKPKGCLSTVTDDRGRKTVMEYIDDNNKRLFPIGRLDYDSEGLLLITDDGALAQILTHPSHVVDKTYSARIEGKINETELNTLRNGIEIDKVKLNECVVRVLEETDKYTKLDVVISEGKNRQIKKMFEAVGKNIIFLKRTKIGDLRLGGLGRGQSRPLTTKEIDYLKSLGQDIK